LETMARALFKSWFVDFDPVRAKAEGRDPGLPKHIADLFPDRFEDSALGEIPAGWEVKVLDDLVSAVLGGDWGGDEPTPENTMAARCIRGADIPDLQAGGMGKMPIRYLKPSSLEKRRLTDGDLVVEISRGSPIQSTGRPVLVSDRLLRRLDAPLVCSNFCRLLKPTKPTYSKFVYLWLRALYTNDEFLQFENGTTGIKNLAFTLFSSSYRQCVPPEAVLTEFEAQVAPPFARQQAGAAETDSLAALRDTLLPKLISGDLRVRDADKVLADATVLRTIAERAV
ncbi:MAG: restriction endonuclease subunit S, partial [bacterium]